MSAEADEAMPAEESMTEEGDTETDTAETDTAETDKMDDSAMSETHAMTDTVEGDSETDGEMAETEAAEEVATDEEMAAVDLPAWQKLALTDARSGESFTFADFNGKTVFVEPMATWCSNCRRQLTNVQEASAQLGDDVVFVALSVETNIGGDTLAAYANDAGFDYTFAVMTPEMLGELAGAFGQTISNPPATPHFIILPDGSTTDLVTGIEPAADIVAQIEAARG
jgi:thiol-disulfide isomerase/thioredoxin